MTVNNGAILLCYVHHLNDVALLCNGIANTSHYSGPITHFDFSLQLGGNPLRGRSLYTSYTPAGHITIIHCRWFSLRLLSIWGGQSSFTMFRLNLKWKYLGEILVCNPGGCQSSFTISRLNPNLKNLGDILVTNPGRCQSSFTMPRLNLNLKIIGDILFCNPGRCQSSFTISRLNLNWKIFRWDSGLQSWGVSIIFHHAQAKS